MWRFLIDVCMAYKALFSFSGEADIVSHHVEKLIMSGLSASQIAVVAPYNLQVTCCTCFADTCTHNSWRVRQHNVVRLSLGCLHVKSIILGRTIKTPPV